ncbi:MAG: thiol-disulfide oxidoreductase DCC family protein [Sphingobacteriales bacterium]|nr:thiol-disulfide oxidoreductase DCC family protein [Sphingobacteriales bacterium]
MNTGHSIVLFDGVCNLCNRSVQFIIKRDKKDRFRFAALQGKTGQALLAKHDLPSDSFNSFILAEGDRIYTRSTGALQMLKRLGGPWSLCYVFILVPRFIRDGVYNWVARNRYRWFGKKESCMIPTPALKNKFLD